MNFEQSQNMVRDIIDREVSIEHEYDFKYMREEDLKKLNAEKTTSESLYKELLKKLDSEGQKLLRLLINSKDMELFYAEEYYFERGVRCGLTTLSFINKYCDLLYQ